jgi:torulene dioxygenase
VHIEKKGFFADSIIKIDAKRRKVRIWTPKTNHMPSEPIFVAHPKGKAEDDGVLLTVALDARRKLSSLIILDAQTMKEVARAE